jgi:hypothetical protein
VYQESWARQDTTESGYEADDSANDESDPAAAGRQSSACVYTVTFPDSFHFFVDCFLDLLSNGKDEEGFLYTAGRSTQILASSILVISRSLY